MRLLSYLYGSPKAESVPTAIEDVKPSQTELSSSESEPSSESSNSPAPSQSPVVPPTSIPEPLVSTRFAISSPNLTRTFSSTSTPSKKRRFSFRPFNTASVHPDGEKHILSTIEEHDKRDQASAAFAKRFTKPLSSNSDKRAKESAVVVRNLILGPNTAAPKVTASVARPQLNKIKSQLIQPKAANKLIAQLRAMPVGSTDSQNGSKIAYATQPIHAVCLEHTEEEEHSLYFAHLDQDTQSVPVMASSPSSMDKLANLFNDMRIVSLVTSPDLGLGQPGNGPGLLAGAVPTAETVINGIQQITPQLLALGFATGKAILPDHAGKSSLCVLNVSLTIQTGVHPPTDRISVLTYWWGLEVALPPPSIAYLSNVQSITDAVMNFLSALALINNGVREILPFVRYISQFIDFEFGAIKSQNKGKGVVCAATWIMPAAMVPRPWDFPDPPATEKKVGKRRKSDVSELLPSPAAELPVTVPNLTFTSPTPSPETISISKQPSPQPITATV